MEDRVIPFFENIRIQVRDTDGYINATKMCSDVGKSFSSWFQAYKTREFLYNLYKQIDDDIDLINEEKKNVYVHPLLAINIAQWISPLFEIQVSKWIYKLYMTGETKYNNYSFRDLEKDKAFLHYFLNFDHSDETPVFFYVYSTPKFKIHYFIGITPDINETMTNLKKKIKHITIETLIYSKHAKNIKDTLVSVYLNSIPRKIEHNSISDGLENINELIHGLCQILHVKYYHCSKSELNMYNDMLKNNCEILFTILNDTEVKPIVKHNWPTPLKKREKLFIEFDDNGNVLRKKCSRCGQIKPPSCYNIKKGKPGNISSECIDCKYNIIYLETPIVKKKCKKCNLVKDVDCFYPSRVSSDRYENKCKECRFGTKTVL